MGIRIVLADNEPIALALRRFKKLVERHGVLWESRRRSVFVKATDERRAKDFQRRFRSRKAMLLAKTSGQQPTNMMASNLSEEFWRRTGKK